MKETITLEPVQIKDFNLELEGTTSLLIHKFSDAAKRDMVNKQTGKTKEKKLRDIKQEVKDSIYYLSDGNVGFPASGFKKAIVEVAPYMDTMDKKKVKGSMYVIGTENDLVPIKFKKQVVNEATVKLSGRGNVTMVRYRPEFQKWKCSLNIKYNASQITPDQIVNLTNLAGFHIGVGDWRPQCSGTYGMFRVKASGGGK